VRAAIRGVIDFREAKLTDPNWWKRCRMLLNGLAREDDQQLHRGVLDYHLALVANSGLTEDSFKTAQENARNAFYDILGSLRPWEGASAADRKRREIEDLRQAYIKEFGDPSTPEFKAARAEELRKFHEHRNKLIAEYKDDWTLLQERIQQYKQDIKRRSQELARRRQLRGGQGRG